MFNTDIPANDILELFGKTFFEFCQDSGYDKILQVLGATPRDFLQVRYIYMFQSTHIQPWHLLAINHCKVRHFVNIISLN